MGDESALRALVREAIKTGKLPPQRPERMWGGPGWGAACAVCGKVIRAEEVEIEVQFIFEGDPETSSYHVHTRCFGAWEHEHRMASRMAPTAACCHGHVEEGIMRDREHKETNQGERG